MAVEFPAHYAQIVRAVADAQIAHAADGGFLDGLRSIRARARHRLRGFHGERSGSRTERDHRRIRSLL